MTTRFSKMRCRGAWLWSLRPVGRIHLYQLRSEKNIAFCGVLMDQIPQRSFEVLDMLDTISHGASWHIHQPNDFTFRQEAQGVLLKDSFFVVLIPVACGLPLVLELDVDCELLTGSPT